VNLLATELTRFFARRITRVTVAFGLLLVAVVLTIVTLNGHVETRTEPAGSGIATLLVALILGATFVAAEFCGDSLTSQLLFEPLRANMHAAKGLAVFVGGTAISLALTPGSRSRCSSARR
jgi:hypothetical protein